MMVREPLELLNLDKQEKIWVYCETKGIGGFTMRIPIEICQEYSCFFYERYAHCFGCGKWKKRENQCVSGHTLININTDQRVEWEPLPTKKGGERNCCDRCSD